MVIMLVDFSMALAGSITGLKEACEMWLLFQFSILLFIIVLYHFFEGWGVARGADRLPKHFTSYHLCMYARTLCALFLNVF